MQTEIPITFNDKELMIPTDLRLSVLLEQQGVNQGCFVAVVNDKVVPKTQLDVQPVNAGDRIEILSPITGG